MKENMYYQSPELKLVEVSVRTEVLTDSTMTTTNAAVESWNEETYEW